MFYVNCKDLKKPLIKLIRRLYEVILWWEKYLQCLKNGCAFKGHCTVHLNCGKLKSACGKMFY